MRLSDTELGSQAVIVSGSISQCRRAIGRKPAVNIGADTTVVETGELLRQAIRSRIALR